MQTIRIILATVALAAMVIASPTAATSITDLESSGPGPDRDRMRLEMSACECYRLIREERGHRAAQGWQHLSRASVGRKADGRRRDQVHRDSARPECPGADRGAAARTGVTGENRRDGGGHRPRSQESSGRGSGGDSGDRYAPAERQQKRLDGQRDRVTDRRAQRPDEGPAAVRTPTGTEGGAVDLATLVATTAELLGGDPALKDVRVRVEGAVPQILADPELLKIVFVNLLVNSAHAMQGRGTIRVSLAAVADTSQITFADEGPGIPSEVLDKIFVPFFTTKARGSGLGLPTAKRLVEAHHGHISIVCPIGGGTVVPVKLPGAAVAAS
jgi:hypothetical protein